MKKVLLATLLVTVLMVGSSGLAMAAYVDLLPGSGFVLSGSDPLPANTPVTSVTSTYDYNAAGVTMKGSLYQEVLRATSDGNLIFAYTLTHDSASNNSVALLSTANFSDILTQVAYVPDGAAIVPQYFARNTTPGSTVGFYFSSPSLSPGNTSVVMWIKTDAPYYTGGNSTVQDGVSQNVFTYAPSKVPEPATLSMLGFGLMGLGGVIRRKFMA